MDWATAIQRKRQQWVGGLSYARKQNNDLLEQALTNLMTQLGAFEREYLVRRQKGEDEEAIMVHLSGMTRNWLPELWATMSDGISSGTPEAWLANPYIVVDMVVEKITSEEGDSVSFTSRINQLDTLPLSDTATDLLATIIDESWARLKPRVEEAKATMEHWEYAAFMHQLSRYFRASYGKTQVNAIGAVREAEETGQLIEISSQAEADAEEEES